MADKSEVAAQHEIAAENGAKSNGIAAAPARKRGCGAHLRRFWWVYIVALIIVALAVVLPIIFVAIPKVGQKEVNKSTLEVTEQIVVNPKPSAVDIKLTNIARSDSKFHPDLSSFRAALYLLDTKPNIKPFGYVQIPASKADKETVIHVDSTLEVADMDQFKAYNELVMKNETFSFGVKGDVGMKLGSLPKFNVDYDKTVIMKGLNSLHGFQVLNFNISLKTESDGTNMVGQLLIPNPSVLTIEMGNVTLDMSVAGTPIGTTLIPNFTLKPGNNTVDMRSATDQVTVIGLLTKTYKDGILPIDIVGNSSINSAGEHLPYYEAAIRANKMSVSLDVGKALLAIGLNITQVNGQ